MNASATLAAVALWFALVAQSSAAEQSTSAKIAALTARIAASPADVSLYSHRGDENLFAGNFPAAVADFEKMIEIDPKLDVPHWRLGIAYYFAGSYEKASHQFAKYHTYENRDRENGIWKFMSDAKARGVQNARQTMLSYDQFDREPFPALYDLFAGRTSKEKLLANVASSNSAADRTVEFFAHYYAGVYEQLLGQDDAARTHLQRAIAVYSAPGPSAGGASYMWRVGRLHLDQLNLSK